MKAFCSMLLLACVLVPMATAQGKGSIRDRIMRIAERIQEVRTQLQECLGSSGASTTQGIDSTTEAIGSSVSPEGGESGASGQFSRDLDTRASMGNGNSQRQVLRQMKDDLQDLRERLFDCLDL